MSTGVLRGFGLLLAAAALIGLGIAGILGIHATYVACEVSLHSDACLAVLDEPQYFLDTLQTLWAIALAVTVVSCVLAPGRGPRLLTIAAAAVVAVMNSMTEYSLWLILFDGRREEPPGMGYLQAAALLLAALLVAMAAAATIARARSTQARSARTDAETAPPANATDVAAARRGPSPNVRRAIGLLVAAAVLIGLGIAGILATHETFVPCEISQQTDGCYDAMDGPGHFYGSLQVLWLIALATTVTACVLAPARAPRQLCYLAAAVVLFMNQVTEYAIWLGVYGGHWDVPPGTGYTQSAAFLLAAFLVAMGAAVAIEREHVTLPEWGARERALRDEIAAGA